MGRKRRQKQPTLIPAHNEALRNPPPFVGFYDKGGYNGKPPSRAVLQAGVGVSSTITGRCWMRNGGTTSSEIAWKEGVGGAGAGPSDSDHPLGAALWYNLAKVEPVRSGEQWGWSEINSKTESSHI